MPWGFGQLKEKRERLLGKNFWSVWNYWKNNLGMSLILVETTLASWMLHLFLCSVTFTLLAYMAISSARYSTPKSFLGLRGAPKERVCSKVFPRSKEWKSTFPIRETKGRVVEGGKRACCFSEKKQRQDYRQGNIASSYFVCCVFWIKELLRCIFGLWSNRTALGCL